MSRLHEAGELASLVVGAALAHVGILRLPSGNPFASELVAAAALIGVCCAGMAIIMRRSESRLLIFLTVLFSAPLIFGGPALLLSSVLRSVLH